MRLRGFARDEPQPGRRHRSSPVVAGSAPTSGSTHPRRASIHPLLSIASGETDVRGAWFAIAGDTLAARVVDDLEGRRVEVDDERRAAYHAAACIASNHLVALLGQVERVAASAGVPLDALLDLARQSIDNVAALGPRAALTGPVARGDWETVERHRATLEDADRRAYDAMVELAQRLANDIEIAEAS